MKRIFVLIIALMMVGSGASAGNQYISGPEAERIAMADFQAYAGLTESELSDFVANSDEVEDWSFKNWGLARRVCTVFDVHPGLPDLSVVHFIAATDGEIVNRVYTPFATGEDLRRYYHSLKACSESLYAQEVLEKTYGPFRTWTKDQQEQFYARYGNFEDFLNEYYYPLPTDIQSWEARQAADQYMMERYGCTEEDLAQLVVETSHCYDAFDPDFWFVDYKQDANALQSITIEVYHEGGEIVGVEQL